MGDDLLIFAIAMACLAVGVTIYCIIAEASEAWQITHDGWALGHRHHRRSSRAADHR
jgi:hypothetical protein